MAIFFTIIGVFFGYRTSQYFPKDVPFFTKSKSNYNLEKISSALCHIISLCLFISIFDLATGVLLFLFSTCCTLSLATLLLPIHPKFVYMLSTIALLSILIDLI